MEIKITGTEKELAGFVLGIQGGQAQAPKAQDVKDFIRKSTDDIFRNRTVTSK